jgi:ABC-type iron transport system FetAB ATPase subunit
VLLGPSGVGKSTAARQALKSLTDGGFHAWQHKDDQTLLPSRWRELARYLQSNGLNGVLLVDNAHAQLSKINELSEGLDRDGNTALKIILVSTNHNWGPRIKSSALFKSVRVVTR